MDLQELGRTVIRRWYLAVAILLLSVGVSVGVAHVVSPRYTAVASAVLIPPQSTVSNAVKTSVYAPPNPLLYLGGLTQSRDILLRTLGSAEVSDGVKARFPDATYDASPDTTSSGPLIVITARGGTDSETVAVMKLLSDRVPVALADIQQQLGISQDNRISSLVLTQDEKSAVDRKSQLQASVFGGAGTALVGFLLLGLWDNIISSRRRALVPAPRGYAEKTPPAGTPGRTSGPSVARPVTDYPRQPERRGATPPVAPPAPDRVPDDRPVMSGSALSGSALSGSALSGSGLSGSGRISS